MIRRMTFHRGKIPLALNRHARGEAPLAWEKSARGLALGLALLLAAFSLPGCSRRNAVSLRVVSEYSGRGVANAALTFTGSSGSESLASDATGTVVGTSPGRPDTAERGSCRIPESVRPGGRSHPAARDHFVVPTLPWSRDGGVCRPAHIWSPVTVWNTTTTTRADGTFTFEGLAEGTYAGRVTKQGFADATFSLVVGEGAKAVTGHTPGGSTPATFVSFHASGVRVDSLVPPNAERRRPVV